MPALLVILTLLPGPLVLAYAFFVRGIPKRGDSWQRHASWSIILLFGLSTVVLGVSSLRGVMTNLYLILIFLPGLLVLAYALFVRGIPRRRDSRRRHVTWWTVLVVGMLLLGLAVLGLEQLTYRLARGYHVALLAAAVSVYHHDYGDLPDTLAEIERTGMYGPMPYRAPTRGFTTNPTGPPPHYLKAKTFGIIVAVEAVTRRSKGTPRGYVVFGSTTAQRATEEELVEILAEDDMRRAAAGEEGRWASVNWRSE